jgi:hypothetical protein
MTGDTGAPSGVEPVVRPWLIALVAVVLTVDVAWLALSRVDVDWQGSRAFVALPLGWLILFFGLSRAAERHSRPPVWLDRAQSISAGLLFLSVAWLAMRLFNHLSFSIALPLVDDWLLSLDRALGLDWRRYFDLVAASPLAIGVLDASYFSLDTLSVVALLTLLALGLRARARVYIETFFLCAALAAVTGFWFPAEAAVVHLLGDEAAFPTFARPPGVYHMVHLELLRRPEGDIILNLGRMPGLITFPSFHTAAGIVLAAAF